MIDKTAKAKIINNTIIPTDWQKIQGTYQGLVRLSNAPNWTAIPIAQMDITAINNDLIRVSQIIADEYPYFSSELFALKDRLFIGYGCLNPAVYGQVIAIFKAIVNEVESPRQTVWGLIHPKIVAVSKQLYLDGHYANAACDAFIEINDRIKQIYHDVNPSATEIPDGQALINKVFSEKTPLIELCDRSTETGVNVHNGTRSMLSGAMAALRNPKAHANITITADDAMRRLMFASMLMYTLDEVKACSNE